MTELPDGTVTLLFSDIEGSTALLKRLGDGWPGVLERQRTLLREAIDAGDGVVVDCQGDAMFAAFRSAPAAVSAAVRAQTHMAREAWPDGTAVRVRMALHTGEPHRTEDGGYTGIDVVRAARLCAAGHGGQVLLTEAARLVSGAETTDLGPATLPDMDHPERISQFLRPVWLQASRRFAPTPPRRSRPWETRTTISSGESTGPGRRSSGGSTSASRMSSRERWTHRSGSPREEPETVMTAGRAHMTTPAIVSEKEWEAARENLLVKEKELTRARDALAAERRRMPWKAVEKEYEFDGPDGKASLLDLFEGRRQLVVYRVLLRARRDTAGPTMPASAARSWLTRSPIRRT